MLAVGHSAKGRHGLTLAAGGDDNQLTVFVALHILDIDEDIFRDFQIAQIGGDLHHIFHAPAVDDNLALIAGCRVNDLLHPVHV